ncbi:MAG: enoyl-CoA hydratase-related protein [Sulfobacillus sp.]
MSEAEGPVVVRVEAKIAWLTISNPPANALAPAVLEALDAALGAVDKDPAVRVVVLTAVGPHFFSAGADLKGAMGTDLPAYLQRGQTLFSQLETLPRPTIAMIQGTALGGGLELAMACDIRLCADRARLGQPETTLGIIPAWGGTQRLPRLVGRGRALEMILTGALITAEQAENWGLVNRSLPPDQLVDLTRNLAGRLAQQPPIALAEAKAALHQGLSDGIAAGMIAERQAMARVITSDDAREGLVAFLEKRRPHFQGR